MMSDRTLVEDLKLFTPMIVVGILGVLLAGILTDACLGALFSAARSR
jgi:hypothetical protein